MTGSTQKFRAVFLAALMVLSVFAGTVAFAGTAAADASSPQLSQSTVEPGTSVTVSTNDGGTDDGSTLYAVLDVNGDQQYNSDSDQLISTSSQDGTDSVEIGSFDTSGLSDGDYEVYVVEASSEPTDLTNADASTTLTVSSPDDNSNPSFEGAVEYDADGDGNDGDVELAFSEGVSGSDGNALEVGSNVDVTLNGDNVNGEYEFASSSTQQARFVLVNTNDSRTITPSDDLEVEIGQVQDGAGNTRDVETVSVTETSTTVTPDGDGTGDTDLNAYVGERIALNFTVADDDFEINSTDEFLLSGSTGVNSQVFVWNTKGRDGSLRYMFEDSVGDTGSGSDDDGATNFDNYHIELRNLNLQVTPDDTTITDNDELTGTISSRVGDRAVSVTLNEPDDDEQTRTIRLNGSGGATFNFGSGLDKGNYTVEVTDQKTGVSVTSDEISVEEVSGEASFQNKIVTDQRGDVVNITVELENTDTANVTVGTNDIGYSANVTVEDGNDDGQVVLQWNTYNVGENSNSNGDQLTEFSVADSDDEIVSGENPISVSPGTLIDNGEYELQIRSGTTATADNAEEVGTVNLQQRSTDGSNTWVAPNRLNIDNRGDVYDAINGGNLTQTGEIANGEIVVHQIQASGLEGAIAERGAPNTTADFYTLERTGQINLAVNQTNPGANRAPKLFDLNNRSSQVIVDADNDSYFVVYDLDSPTVVRDENENGNVDAEDTTTVSVSDGDAFAAHFNVSGNSDLSKNGESTTTNYQVVEPTLDVDSDPFNVSAAPNQTITGESSLAPGTEVTVRVSSTGDTQPKFLKPGQTALVTQNGTWATTFNFSEQNAGDTYEIKASARSLSETVDGTVQEQVTETSEPTTDAAPNTTTAAGTTATTTDVTTSTTTAATGGTTTSGSETTPAETTQTTPGFGVVVAVTALLAAALLAVRRD